VDTAKKTLAEQIQERRARRLDLRVQGESSREEAEQVALRDLLTKAQCLCLKAVEAVVELDNDQRHCLITPLTLSEAVILTNTPSLLRPLAHILDEEGLALLVCVDRSIRVFNFTLDTLLEIALVKSGTFGKKTVELSDGYNFDQKHTYALLATWP